jgi:hypothetical protein
MNSTTVESYQQILSTIRVLGNALETVLHGEDFTEALVSQPVSQLA